MNDSLARRIRRVVLAAFEPSSWRAYRFLGPFKPTLPQGIAIPGPDTVERIIPAERDFADSIPDLIFQTWKSRTDIPANYRYWRQTFVDKNPDAQVILWDDDDNRAFIARKFSWFLNIYDQFPQEIFRADAVRYFFLFTYGGLYADMDSECLAPLKLAHRKEAVILGRMGADSAFEHSVPNALMASRPGQVFWLLVIQNMLDVVAANPSADLLAATGPEAVTGPVLLKRSLDEFRALDSDGLFKRVAPVLEQLDDAQTMTVRQGDVSLLLRNAWYPLDWTNPAHKKLRDHLNRNNRILSPQETGWIFRKAELATYWSHSW